MIGLIFGYLGGTLVILSFGFQGYKTYKDKELSSLSISTFVLAFFVGSIWTLAGWFQNNFVPSYITNYVVTLVASYILFNILKKKYYKIKTAFTVLIIGSIIGSAIFIFNIFNGEEGRYLEHSETAFFWITLFAGFLTAISFVPQLITTIKSKDAHNLSLPMLALNVLSQTLWIFFWLLKIFDDISLKAMLPGLLWTCLTFIVMLSLMIYKIKWIKTLRNKK